MIQLRPHHLLCLLTYVGKGYSPAFVNNYDRIAARLNAGEKIRITDKPDDICAPIAGDLTEHCHGHRVITRDDLTARDVGKLLGVDVRNGTTLKLTPERISMLRAAFATGKIRAACKGCQWHDLCTEVADNGYTNCRVLAPHTLPKAAKSGFAGLIDGLYGATLWFRMGGVAFLLILLITQDDLRHALMNLMFPR
ncbi:DUF1284 domain-containing protein [Celeribacter litoreus]|uniref:DUF1284 domain-containing protein n=1 Tax=Celeribacter litoreus TaxID=2876714 RepID=UPI001CC95310|nr:DUF1284 domain-containing protein [Celeribacter litoreus]MCA0044643.1 DUF1284 domain-containing protein [Celeribacter litoreus]